MQYIIIARRRVIASYRSTSAQLVFHAASARHLCLILGRDVYAPMPLEYDELPSRDIIAASMIGRPDVASASSSHRYCYRIAFGEIRCRLHFRYRAWRYYHSPLRVMTTVITASNSRRYTSTAHRHSDIELRMIVKLIEIEIEIILAEAAATSSDFLSPEE